MIAALVKFLELPSRILIYRKYARSRLRFRDIKLKLSTFIDEVEVTPVGEGKYSSIERPVENKQRMEPIDEDEVEKAVRRSVKFAREGYMSKSTKDINSKPLLDPLNPITKAFLIAMHLKAKLLIPELPENDPHAHIENNIDFNKCLNKFIRG